MTRLQRNVLSVSITTSFITTFTASALNLSVPDMALDFHVSAAAIGWIVTAYALTANMLTVPCGRVSDMRGRKRMLMAGIGLFAVSSVSAGFAPGFAAIIASRVLQGVGGAMIFATNQAVIVRYFPGNIRGRALGISVASTYTGLALGPVLGGVINQYLGWRFIFFFMFFVCLIAFVTACRGLPADAAGGKGFAEDFDVRGSLLFMLMMFCLMFGLTMWSSGLIFKLLVPAGLALGTAFVLTQLREELPLLKVSMFRDLRYSLSNAATFLNYASTFAISYLLSIYLQTVMGYGSRSAGLILIVQPAIMALLSPVMGRLSDRVSPFRLATAGMALCTVTLVMLTFLSTDSRLWYIILLLAVAGLGFSVFSSPNTNAVMSLVEKEDVGVATSILNTMRNMGQNVSMALITSVVTARLGDLPLAEASPRSLVSVMRMLYIIFAVLSAAGVFCSMGRSGGKHQA